jgi:hypothetical protein
MGKNSLNIREKYPYKLVCSICGKSFRCDVDTENECWLCFKDRFRKELKEMNSEINAQLYSFVDEHSDC